MSLLDLLALTECPADPAGRLVGYGSVAVFTGAALVAYAQRDALAFALAAISEGRDA